MFGKVTKKAVLVGFPLWQNTQQRQLKERGMLFFACLLACLFSCLLACLFVCLLELQTGLLTWSLACVHVCMLAFLLVFVHKSRRYRPSWEEAMAAGAWNTVSLNPRQEAKRWIMVLSLLSPLSSAWYPSPWSGATLIQGGSSHLKS